MTESGDLIDPRRMPPAAPRCGALVPPFGGYHGAAQTVVVKAMIWGSRWYALLFLRRQKEGVDIEQIASVFD
jgi:hypothetical protein